MVSEGLADHFSMEVTGIAPPPWAVALTPGQMDAWRAEAERVWTANGYNHAAWFLGASPTIPRWTGYTLGFCPG